MSRVMQLLGLGLRAGNVVVGVAGTRAALRNGRCHCVVVAADASPRAVEKVVRLAEGRGVPSVVGPSAATLGARLGRPAVMVVAVIDPALARGVVRAGDGVTED
jgi:ribosomal protein L7Ae-like RNA K-turn-binding protein